MIGVGLFPVTVPALIELPYAVVRPYSKPDNIIRLLALTVPLRVAEVQVAFAAANVVTV